MLEIPKLRHGGGSDDAPQALENLIASLDRQWKLPSRHRERLISATDPALFDYPILYMHGRREFRLSSSERDAIRAFVERGGVILADAICASPEFASSFRREMQSLSDNAI